MKKIEYFKRHDLVPKGATYLCFKKKLIREESTKAFPVYEDLFVYEVEQDPEKLKEAQ
jgi:hypothetical protein